MYEKKTNDTLIYRYKVTAKRCSIWSVSKRWPGMMTIDDISMAPQLLQAKRLV